MSRPNIASILGTEAEAELYKKKAEVEQDRIRKQYDQLQEQKRETEALKTLNFGNYDESYIESLAKGSTDYLMKARNAKVFLTNDFIGKVPFFPRNLILVGAETGVGKSTLSANLSYHTIMQGLKVLVLTNEEHPSDVYNRVSCLIRGWFYANHEKFNDEQIQYFEQNIKALARRMTVISDNYRGISGCTTTLEGIQNVLESVYNTNSQFDLIILDYYQNVDRSTDNDKLDAYAVQYRLCKYLDQYKNKSNAPIIVLAQKKPSGKDKELLFKDAIEGRKTIVNIATCALNVAKDVDNSRTSFEIIKSRFNSCVGDKVFVGFDKGKYVPYDNEFKNEAQNRKIEKEKAKILGGIKLNNSGGN